MASTRNRSGLLSAPESTTEDARTTPSRRSGELQGRKTSSVETRLGRRHSQGSLVPSAVATLERPGAEEQIIQGPIPPVDCPAGTEELSAEGATALHGLAEFVRSEVKRVADTETCEVRR